MNAEIIAVGSEMLTPERVDTNSLYLTDELNTLGVEVVTKCVIGDDRERLADGHPARCRAPAIVILTGGLGPTEDDLTREAVARRSTASWSSTPRSPRRWSSASRSRSARWPRSTSARRS